jgi:hypothetical protein
MTTDAKLHSGSRGAAGLIRACDAMGALCTERETAAERLEGEMGQLEARRLIALLTRPGRRLHWREQYLLDQRQEAAAA